MSDSLRLNFVISFDILFAPVFACLARRMRHQTEKLPPTEGRELLAVPPCIEDATHVLISVRHGPTLSADAAGRGNGAHPVGDYAS